MGIFFRGSSPSAPPFIREGEKVKAGTPICLIEAMKVFNEVKAPNDCIIKKVLVENGQPVKPGDLLFFPGHVAIYLGNGKIIHATGHPESSCVTFNSLREGEPGYREDLKNSMCAAGSIF